MEEYLIVIKKYATFNGRASRREFWMFVLINFLIGIGIGIIDSALGFEYGQGPNKQGIIGSIYSLAVFLPGLAVSVRRLHDTNKPGWILALFYGGIIAYLLLILNQFNSRSVLVIFGLAVIAASIWLIVMFATKGDEGPNKYGPDPCGSDDLEIEDHLI